MTDSQLNKRAIVLLSGGLDSATALAIARDEGFDCLALSFAYGQRHQIELAAARQVAKAFSVVEHRKLDIDLAGFGGSALTDSAIAIPEEPYQPEQGIPVTYVPARNTIFLSLALAWAEVMEVFDIFIGINAVDYSGYPDCRAEFIRAFETMANLATRAGVEGRHVHIHTPLIELSKADIIRRGVAFGVDYSRTISCYQPDPQGRACGRCDSCRLRRQGFADAGLDDPTRYQG
jgi:7-cyano-7-deazaguanine synthase